MMELPLDNKRIGHIKVSSPSNIAFVKYWGKKGRQLPLNSSVSMTLKNCVTTMNLEFFNSNSFELGEFLFEGKEKPKFKKRIEEFLNSIKDEFKFLNQVKINIKCSNSFPHSSGIASSASSMSALIFALFQFKAKYLSESFSLQEASFYARLGSGSAARSLFPNYSMWGEHEQVVKASNEYAIAINEFASCFSDLQDAVLIIDSGEKKVSSSQGHILMNAHFYKDLRIEQAQENTMTLLRSLKSGDFKEFGRIVELEALSLHSLMMTSDPSFILMTPNTLKAIEKIREFRENKKVQCFFTLDAGANLHLIYKKEDKEKVESFIEEELKLLCVEGKVIFDELGQGPLLLEVHLE